MAIDVMGLFSNLGTTSWLLLLIIFVLFVLSMKKVLKIVMNTIWIIIAAFLFPIFMNRVLGLAVPADIDSIVLLAVAGVGLYFIYLVAKSIYGLLGAAEKFGKKIAPSMPKVEGKTKKDGKKPAEAEKPKKGEPIPPQYFYKASKAKSGKDQFRDYVVIGDTKDEEIKEPVKTKSPGRFPVSKEDDYVELSDLKEEKEQTDASKMRQATGEISLDEEEKGFQQEEKAFMEEEKEFMKKERMHKVPEIKFKGKGKKKAGSKK